MSLESTEQSTQFLGVAAKVFRNVGKHLPIDNAALSPQTCRVCVYTAELTSYLVLSPVWNNHT
jgi:hypothetical protein